MELDDLKNAWKHDKLIQKQPLDIMEMIHQKSKGPISSLKRSFKRQMISIAALMTVIMVANVSNLETTPGYILFFTLVAFCIAVIIALFVNFRFTKRMGNMDNPVKANLQYYVTILDKRLDWQYMGSRFVVLILILLVEILPLFYDARMLNTWHAVSPLIRFSAYAFYFLIVYLISRRVKQKKFGQHLDHLKNLLKELG